MHYNLKLEMERVNGMFVSQLEVSGVGRAARDRLVSDTFENALEAVKKRGNEMIEDIRAYHLRGQPAPAPEPPPPAPKKKAKAKKAAAPKKPRKPKPAPAQ